MSDALLFWFIAASMAALALAFALPGLRSRRAPPPRARRTEINAAIYRSELADLDRERAEGRLTDPQYARGCDEIERRLLSDTAGAGEDPPPVAGPRGAAIVLSLALPAFAFGLYAVLGDPAALDGGHAATPMAADGPAALPLRRDELVRHLARNAGDGRGWVLLARLDFDTDRFADAAASYEKALGASPKIAADPAVWCEYADALGMAQGGMLAGRPRELVMRALTLDPAYPKALEMAGSVAYEQRDFAAAAQHWRQLLAQLPDRSAQHRELATAIARVERLALASSGGPGTSK